MKKIHIGFMKNVKNSEFKSLYDCICEGVAVEKNEIPSIQSAWQRVEYHQSKLAKLQHQKWEHPLTKVIQDQVATRTEYLASLRLGVESKMLSNKPEERTLALRLHFWLKRAKEGLFAPTIGDQGVAIHKLMVDRMLDSEIREATALLYHDELLESITEVSESITTNCNIRMDERDVYVVNGKAIREKAYKDLKQLIEIINVIYYQTNDIELKKKLEMMSLRINADIKKIRTQFKSRITKRKNKKEIAAAFKELMSIQHEPQKALPVGNMLEDFLKSTPKRRVSDEKDIRLNETKSTDNPSEKKV